MTRLAILLAATVLLASAYFQMWLFAQLDTRIDRPMTMRDSKGNPIYECYPVTQKRGAKQ